MRSILPPAYTSTTSDYSYSYSVPRVSVNVTTKPVPTSIPTPLSGVTGPLSGPTPTIAPTAIINKGGDELSYMMAAINDYRRARGLSTVQTDPYTCSFATVRAAEIAKNFNHDGFTSRINSHMLPYPSYHEVTENLAMTNDYKNVVNMWINSPGHAANMQKDTSYACVASNGSYFVYEGWMP